MILVGVNPIMSRIEGGEMPVDVLEGGEGIVYCCEIRGRTH
jgi:hypothetical protein